MSVRDLFTAFPSGLLSKANIAFKTCLCECTGEACQRDANATQLLADASELGWP